MLIAGRGLKAVRAPGGGWSRPPDGGLCQGVRDPLPRGEAGGPLGVMGPWVRRCRGAGPQSGGALTQRPAAPPPRGFPGDNPVLPWPGTAGAQPRGCPEPWWHGTGRGHSAEPAWDPRGQAAGSGAEPPQGMGGGTGLTPLPCPQSHARQRGHHADPHQGGEGGERRLHAGGGRLHRERDHPASGPRAHDPRGGQGHRRHRQARHPGGHRHQHPLPPDLHERHLRG